MFSVDPKKGCKGKFGAMCEDLSFMLCMLALFAHATVHNEHEFDMYEKTNAIRRMGIGGLRKSDRTAHLELP